MPLVQLMLSVSATAWRKFPVAASSVYRKPLRSQLVTAFSPWKSMMMRAPVESKSHGSFGVCWKNHLILPLSALSASVRDGVGAPDALAVCWIEGNDRADAGRSGSSGDGDVLAGAVCEGQDGAA